MEPPAFWRDLQIQFRQLHDPTVDLHAMELDPNEWFVGTHARDPSRGRGLPEQFTALATRAALDHMERPTSALHLTRVTLAV